VKEALSQFIDRHPMALGAFGSVSGISAAALKSLHVVASVAADLGMLCGGATAAVTLAIAIRNWKRGRWERKAEEHAIAIREMYDADHLS
jgi:hypothetical protein